MAEPAALLPLVAALEALIGWLADSQVPGIIIGGVAASLLGRPRATRDVDAVIWLDDERRLPSLVEAARGRGLSPRIDDALGFALQSRVVLLRHDASTIDLDIALGGLPFEKEAIDQAVTVSLGALRVPLPRPEDLIIMKAVAHRPRDMADIEAIIAATGSLDVDRIRGWIRQFSEALESPEMIDDMERLLARHRPG